MLYSPPIPSCGAAAQPEPRPLYSWGFFITQNDASHSVGLPWTSDQLVVQTSTWQHTRLTTNIHAHGGIRTHDLRRRGAADLRLRPRGYWDRQMLYITLVNHSTIWRRLVFSRKIVTVLINNTVVIDSNPLSFSCLSSTPHSPPMYSALIWSLY